VEDRIQRLLLQASVAEKKRSRTNNPTVVSKKDGPSVTGKKDAMEVLPVSIYKKKRTHTSSRLLNRKESEKCTDPLAEDSLWGLLKNTKPSLEIRSKIVPS